MKKKTWILGLFLAVALFFAGNEEVYAKKDMTIHNGVYVDGVDLSGMTQEQAKAAVAAYVEEMGNATLTVEIFGNPLNVTMAELGLSCTNPQVVEEAAKLGRTGNIIRRYKDRKDLEHENKVYELEWTLDGTLVSDFVTTQCTQFDQEAVDASLKRVDGAFEIVPGQTGVKLDAAGAEDVILKYVENEWSLASESIELPVETAYPRGTEEELSRVKDVLGTYTTSYTTSNAARSKNVATGASHLNGIVLYPGDVLSATEAVTPFTVGNGYEPAGSYLNGKVVDSLGGGICQVTTTLYNAVLRAELEVVERSNHSMIVTYVDPAADAAIAEGVKDFKIANNTDAPIYIEGITANKRVTFNIYGEETRPENREVKFASKTLSTTDPGWQIVADPGQPIGYRVVESAHWGYVAELYKYVYVDGAEESVTKVNKSTYKPSPRTITIGIAGDPGLSAELQAAVATQDEALVNATLASCLARMQ